uniref:Uncharacterized protein n=1 Tax=Prevotella sp. GTC17262 TaxID=3236797 RepID=A0AB33JFN3_9BACT
MGYDTEILRVLAEAGKEGLSVRKIARHVLNACNSLFDPVEYSAVYAYVQQYLVKSAKMKNGLVERTETRGRYRLNLDNTSSQQLMLQFCEESAEEVELDSQPEDQSLSLF